MTEGTGSETCYRHRDRETYVRCTRCDRRICPACMNEAAVGFHCPDCVREGNKSVRQARTVFGGKVGDGRITQVLLALNVLGFLYELTVGESAAAVRYGMSPLDIANGEYYRLLTSAFLHFGIAHIAMNMIGLYLYGPVVERELGSSRFLALYVLSALGGSAVSYALSPLNVLGAGASGAIYGLFGAYFVITHRLGRDTTQMIGLIGFNVFLSFTIPNIDWRAHFGGLAVGAAVTWVYAHVAGSNRDTVHGVAVALILALVAAGVLLRTESLRDGCTGDLLLLEQGVVCLSDLQDLQDLDYGGAEPVGG